MEERHLADADDEILKMQAGVRAWVHGAALRGERGLRRVSPPVLLSLLCAAAFCPLLAVAAGVTGAASVAGIGVLSSVGGGVLTEVVTKALDRLHEHEDQRSFSHEELEGRIAQEIQEVLAAGDARASALRVEIAGVLKEIDAGGTALRAAIEAGSEQVRSDVVAAIGQLGAGFAELGFLIKNVAGAAAEIQETLDQQGADVRRIIEQNYRQSTEIRLAREQLAGIGLRTGADVVAGAAGSDRGIRWVHGCPYRGLLPFEEDDEEVFYGRERLTTELAVRLARQMTRGGVIVVTGASGAGKSSLLRAGLLPTLVRGVQVEGSQGWPCSIITPGKDPLTELAAALAALGGGATAAIRDGLARDPGQAHLAVRQAVAADAARRHQGRPPSSASAARLVLIVDQFEQVFTLSPGPDGEAGRRAFITALCTAANMPAGPGGKPSALVVIAVRGDFWDRCADYPELARELQEGQFVVGPMTESDLRLAIVGPADAAGLRIDDALTDTIINDLLVAGGDGAAGVLPLLSQAMLLTWENREGDRLTGHGYGQAGGVSLAVQTSADAVYDAMTAPQQALAREILRRMTVIGRGGRFTRRPVNRADLYSGHPETDHFQIDEVLEAFAAKRLIVLNDGTAQMAHDALLRAWPRLRGWLEDDQASWILHGQLADAAAEWHDRGGDRSFVYRGTQLAAIRQAAAMWSADPARYPALTGTQGDFLRASDRAAARSARQWRAVFAMLVLLLVASLAGFGIAARAARNASQAARNALSGQLAAQSETFDTTDPVTAAGLAAAAWRIAPTALAHESLLDVLAQPERGVLTSSDMPLGVAFSPDGKTLATASGDRTWLWNVATHQQIGVSMTAAEAVAFSPDGRILATAGEDGTARLWDVATHKQVGAPMIAGRGTGLGRGVAVAFSPDGKTLATVSGDGTARLWNVADQRQVGVPMIAGRGTGLGTVLGVAFSPDGKTLATASWDGTARLWNAATHKQVGAPMIAGAVDTGHGVSGVFAVAFSPDGKTLATASPDGTARLWNVADQRQISAPMIARAGIVLGVAFSPDGKTLATAGGDGTARLWDVATDQQLGAPTIASISEMSGVAFSPDGKTLATAGDFGPARLWNVATYRQIGAFMTAGAGGVQAVAFSPDGKTLATASDDGTARLWNAATYRQIGAPMIAGRGTGLGTVLGVAFSPDGRILATTNATTARLWDVATHKQIGVPMTARAGIVLGVAFSPDGKTLATAGGDGTARLWNAATDRQIGAFMTAGAGGVLGVAFSPDGRILATTSGDGTVWLWNVATHKQIGAPMIASTPMAAVAFSPDGKTLATASGDGTVWLWNLATHKQIGAPMIAGPGGPGYGAARMAFSPDGRILATTNATTARLWDVATDKQIGAPMTAGTDSISAVAFSPDGKTLATAYEFGPVVRLWDVAFPGNLLTAVCAIAGGSLTHQQWKGDVPSEPFQRTCP